MRLLFDTHAYFWWVRDRDELSRAAARAIETAGAEVFVSAVVAWEMANKSRLGKWPGAGAVLDDLDDAIVDGAFRPLPVTLAHARLAGALPSPHRDPFDRMLAAQARTEGLALLTRDPAFRTLGCETLW